ncbi:TonB-dependent receptor [Aliikangiella maris]|uniref:TonB-dependent receptor n=2 Tax=Aliikangiella maris TaxID=3162458 RepID=A0ABV3MS01_9GAMM
MSIQLFWSNALKVLNQFQQRKAVKLSSAMLLGTIVSVTQAADSLTSNDSNSLDDSTAENLLVITAELSDENLLTLPGSIALIDSKMIERQQANHFADLIHLAPNVNIATGASRGRFVQIRGIGERSEFAEPVNYSVGVVVDGIDLTGIASAATLLDIQQVEILRGPQGTLYGANGLAGLINIVSHSPESEFYAKLGARFEDYNGRKISGVISNSLTEEFAFRAAFEDYQSDGYMKNSFLNRDNTNNFEESAFKGQLVFKPAEDLTIKGHYYWVDIDNGYDAFSLDANRNTYSDKPGHDRQQTDAGALSVDWQLNQQFRLEAVLSVADSELEYGYDEDWSHPGICDNTACDFDEWGFDWWYSSFDNYIRDNKNQSIDIRLHSSTAYDQKNDLTWVLGVYQRDQEVDLKREYTYQSEDFFSQFETTNRALYGQVKIPLNDQWKITAGSRFESRDADYADSNQAEYHPDEDLWGMKVSAEYHYAPGKMFYGLVSRGYKAGGFNASGDLNDNQRLFETEFMWNYEMGIKGYWLEEKLRLQISTFYQDRDDVQTKQSLVRSMADGRLLQEGGACPCSFTDYIGNAASSTSYGLEIDALWRHTDDIESYASAGWLKAEFGEYLSYTHFLADLEATPPVPYDLNGRAQAHSPDYKITFGSRFYLDENWMINPEVVLQDEFYFSDRHNEKSDNYQLLNLRVSYQQDNWQVNLFANNLTDEDIQTRGFGSFGNDPRKLYEVEPYYQFAAPRVIGISAQIEFD